MKTVEQIRAEIEAAKVVAMAKETKMTLTDRAAAALDATHDYDGRGPRTFQARRRVAEWLDTGRGRRTSIALDVAWLLSVGAA